MKDKIENLFNEVIGNCDGCHLYHTIAQEDGLDSSPMSDKYRKGTKKALQGLMRAGYLPNQAETSLIECRDCDGGVPKACDAFVKIYRDIHKSTDVEASPTERRVLRPGERIVRTQLQTM
jgi:hypothetical protein